MKVEPTELRDAHCKVYVEKTVKAEIQKFANEKGMTFSEAGRRLWLEALKAKKDCDVT
jgi:hypothetical protein